MSRDTVMNESASNDSLYDYGNTKIVTPTQDYITGLEDYETTDYSVTARTKKFEEACTVLKNLKPDTGIDFSSLTEHTNSCTATFFTDSNDEMRVRALLGDIDGVEISRNTQSVTRHKSQLSSQTDILRDQLANVEQTLTEANTQYEYITELARDTGDASALTTAIKNKLQMLDDLTQRRINLTNDDLFVTQYIISNLKKDNIFIDVGANIGFFTLLASNLVGSSGKVYAFEPVPSTYEYLNTNVSKKSNVNIYQIGIHNKTGLCKILDFGIYNNFYNSLGELKKLKSQLSDLQGTINVSTYTVNTITLDEFCIQNDVTPNLIKLDTEDTEDLILSTSLETIKKSKPEVIFEMFNLSVQEGRLEKIISTFSTLGYSCYQFRNNEIVLVKSAEDVDLKYYNYLLTTQKNPSYK